MWWIIEHSTNTQLQLTFNVQNNFYKEKVKGSGSRRDPQFAQEKLGFPYGFPRNS